jgi:hypothetical protein
MLACSQKGGQEKWPVQHVREVAELLRSRKTARFVTTVRALEPGMIPAYVPNAAERANTGD